jgi:hypothetical protein
MLCGYYKEKGYAYIYLGQIGGIKHISSGSSFID